MAVTSTQSTTTALLRRILKDFQHYAFMPGDNFCWRAATKTIVYTPGNDPACIWSLLHEIAHAELKHTDYTFDVDLIKMEAAAWEHATTILALRYDLTIPSDYIEENLDTYRLWLHKRSKCPSCTQNGVQQKKNTYSCINCRCSWRTNEALLCGLRRQPCGDD